jgi:hypothetical protein
MKRLSVLLIASCMSLAVAGAYGQEMKDEMKKPETKKGAMKDEMKKEMKKEEMMKDVSKGEMMKDEMKKSGKGATKKGEHDMHKEDMKKDKKEDKK